MRKFSRAASTGACLSFSFSFSFSFATSPSPVPMHTDARTQHCVYILLNRAWELGEIGASLVLVSVTLHVHRIFGNLQGRGPGVGRRSCCPQMAGLSGKSSQDSPGALPRPTSPQSTTSPSKESKTSKDSKTAAGAIAPMQPGDSGLTGAGATGSVEIEAQ